MSALVRLTALGLVLHAAALGLLAVAYVKRDDVVVEGAYFNRAEGAEDQAAVFSAVGSNGRWIIAGALCLVVGTAVLAAAALGRARTG